MSRRGHAWSRASDRPTTPGWYQQRLHHTAGRPGPRRQRTVTHDQARSRHWRDVWHRARAPSGLLFQVCCPGVVATEFHTRQGMDLSAVPRMSAHDVVTASLRGLELGEVVCAPGVEDTSLLDAVLAADLAAAGQSPQLASRYKPT